MMLSRLVQSGHYRLRRAENQEIVTQQKLYLKGGE
jgi:hypothetical protein